MCWKGVEIHRENVAFVNAASRWKVGKREFVLSRNLFIGRVCILQAESAIHRRPWGIFNESGGGVVWRGTSPRKTRSQDMIA